MQWGRDCGLGSRPARALRRSHWFSYRRARPQAAFECGIRASDWARTPRTRYQCWEIRGALYGYGPCPYLLGTDADTLTMSWTERDGPPVSAPKRRGFGTIVMEAMAEPQRGWCGRP